MRMHVDRCSWRRMVVVADEEQLACGLAVSPYYDDMRLSGVLLEHPRNF